MLLLSWGLFLDPDRALLNYVRNGVVGLGGTRRIFGARNDRSKRRLGAKPGFRGFFVNIFEMARARLEFMKILGSP